MDFLKAANFAVIVETGRQESAIMTSLLFLIRTPAPVIIAGQPDFHVLSCRIFYHIDLWSANVV